MVSVILALVSILGVVIVRELYSFAYENKLALQNFSMRYFSGFADLYYSKHGEYPESENELEKVAASLGSSSCLPFVDVWGNRMLYKKIQNGVAIISAGPDGLFDTKDDIFTNLFKPSRSKFIIQTEPNLSHAHEK